MKRYRYKAKDNNGNLVVGEVEAQNEQIAAKLIRQKGLVVISIVSKTALGFNFISKLKDRITGGDIANFTRQLATMMNAGLPLTETLLILRSQSKGSMQSIVAQILADVEEGESLSSSMSKHQNAFSRTYIALIKSGEVGGVLDEVLVKVADDLEKQEEFKGKVKGALIYPIIIIFGMIAVALIMFLFVIPRLTTLYDQFDAELPLSTRTIIGISDFMLRFWPFVIIGVAGLIYAFSIYRNTQAGKRKLDQLIFRVPIFGELQRQVILTELTRTMSLMIGSGVSILEALNISSQVVGNVVISDSLQEATKMVEKGFPLAFSFSRHPEAFPFILSQMIAVGEETGKMDEVLSKISHVFEVESEQRIKAMTAAIEPLILITLGIGVAFLVISIILPIYNLTTQI